MVKLDITDWRDLEGFVSDLVTKLRAKAGRRAMVLALHGDLGTGKTALTQLLAKQLGVEESVVSPTFTIMKVYSTKDEVFTKLYHLDVYRFESPLELIPLGWHELLGAANTLICVEWAEKIATELPSDTIHLHLELLETGQRTVLVEDLAD